MSGRGKDVAMCDDVAAPRVKVIETCYVTIPDPSRFKSIVQSLTGAGEMKEVSVGRKRVAASKEEAGGARLAGGSSGENQDKRQRSSGCGGPEPEGVDSFKEEMYTAMLEWRLVEDQLTLDWLFNDGDR